ncbi:hypothetical protein ACTOB_001235 [Actinoplanes oblitus]|uniref:Uncharacterized protein n=1 Tax=Actinoplanes oblitus TaxID=3040509 RepID=A0ABY8WJQ0_9ACTN|nr:hypothetical protein [Actinoplanes oblitus]WIM97687.1 hypothetical protein ACTOB_001235 [Actinoplanes oblitus]
MTNSTSHHGHTPGLDNRITAAIQHSAAVQAQIAAALHSISHRPAPTTRRRVAHRHPSAAHLLVLGRALISWRHR